MITASDWWVNYPHLLKSDESSGDEFRQSNEMELDDDDDGERVDGGSVEENRSFWDNQHQLLQVIN